MGDWGKQESGIEGNYYDYGEGDWILIDHPEFDFLRGYITATPPMFNTKFQVHITEADEDRFKHVVGRILNVKFEDIKYKLNTEQIFAEEGYVLNMIDFALIIRDELLFREMTEKLNTIRRVNVSHEQPKVKNKKTKPKAC